MHVDLVPGEAVACLHSINGISSARGNKKLCRADTGFCVLVAQHSAVQVFARKRMYCHIVLMMESLVFHQGSISKYFKICFRDT